MASGSGGSKPTVTTEASSCPEAVLKRNSGDVGWNYGTLCDPTNRDAVKCRLCGFICKAGITRLKFHVAGIKGKGVSICNKASKEDKDVCAAALENPKAREESRE